MTATACAPAVSVIMPTLNHERFIAEAMRSVLEQTFGDLELIVVDDASKDGTADVARAVAATDARVRCLRHPENRGISATTNTGVRAARGGVIAHLDSDDVWLPELLAVETKALADRPDAGAAYAISQGMDAAGNPLSDFRGHAQRFADRPFESMLYQDYTSSITVVARRACYERAGLWDESLRTGCDWDLWMRVSRHFPFAFVNRVLARFRLHGGNTTAPRSPLYADSVDGRVKVLDKVFGSPDLPPSARAMKGLAYCNVYSEAGLSWLDAGEYGRAVRAFARALRAGPSQAYTAVRIAWFVLVRHALKRSPLGLRFVRWTADVRRRRRDAHAARRAGDGDVRALPSPSP